MRIHLILMIGFILFQSCSLAQRGMYSSKSKKAIKYYESARTCFNTIDPISGLPGLECALDYVLKAIRKDSNFTEAYSLASNIFIEKSDIQRAIFYREKMIAKSNRVPSVEYYYLASMYMATGQYLKCKSYAQKFLNQINSNEVLVQKCLKFIKDCDFALKALATPSEFNPINMGAAINTNRPEYFPSITADDSTFLFTRRVIDANAPWGDEQEDIYVSFKQKGYWTNSTLISDQINSFFNEGAPTFSADGKYVIFVGCETGNRGDYEYGGNRKGYGSCDLFASEKVGDKWTKPFNLGPTINSRHWETQPSFSSDGKTLYFIRGLTFDRQVRNPKNQDIYFSELSEEGSWSKPQKLNNNINTSGREESVQIHPDGQTLYFSSNGHTGMGGLDIFMSKLGEDGQWGKPINLGYPINSFVDENSILVSSSGELAYFASNREGGFGSLDLYYFELPELYRPVNTTFMRGKVFDAVTKEPLSAKFELKDLSTGKVFKQAYANTGNGEFLVAIPTNKEFALHAEHEGYLFYSTNYSLDKMNKNENGFTIDVPMSPVQPGSFVLENIFFDVNQWTLKKESNAELNQLFKFLTINPSVKVELSGHTDSDGNKASNQTLSENRAKAVVNWLKERGISENRMVYAGYGDSLPLFPNTSDENKAKNRRTELKIR